MNARAAYETTYERTATTRYDDEDGHTTYVRRYLRTYVRRTKIRTYDVRSKVLTYECNKARTNARLRTYVRKLDNVRTYYDGRRTCEGITK